MEKTGAISCRSCGTHDVRFKLTIVIPNAETTSESEMIKQANEEITIKTNVYECAACGKDTLIDSV